TRSIPSGALLGLVELDRVAGRIAQERLLTGSRRVRDLVDLYAGRADLGDRGVEIVDAHREVARVRVGAVDLHEVQLRAAGIEPVAGAELLRPARDRREAEHIAVERLRRVGIVDTDRHVVNSGGFHGTHDGPGSRARPAG